jgi:DNA-binding response OmpR family regulator
MHLLLIEDNLDLSANVGEFLESRGNTVDYARDGMQGLQLAGSEGYDAVILDLGLPGMDGLTLCRRLRDTARRDIPIVMLTARDTEADKLSGFDAGADDYVTKPFSRGVLQVADLTFDLRTLLIRRGPRAITLAPTGMRILEQLMRASPGVVTREQIERTVWGDDPPGTDAALRGHILIIRNAVDSETEPKLLHTVHGIGYRLA